MLSWLKLGRIRGIKRETVADLVRLIGDPDAVLAKIIEISNHKSSTRLISNIFFQNEDAVIREMESIEKYGAKLIHFNMEEYPWMLREIFNPPIVLTAHGNVNLLSMDLFAIVGTRVPAIASEQLAYKISGDLSKMGITIVSGLASGIDAAAHRAAVENTVAVVGNGIDHIYPIENTSLYKKIVSDGGVIISEFEFGAHPTRESFPQRNRIIAGATHGTLVIEAKEKSGSLITANAALDYNRDVYAVPGFAGDSRYSGSNRLIKANTAKMIDCAEDIYDDIKCKLSRNKRVKDIIDSSTHYDTVSVHRATIDDTKNRILNAMSIVPIGIDDISVALGIPINVIRIALLELEIEEWISRNTRGEFFVLN